MKLGRPSNSYRKRGQGSHGIHAFSFSPDLCTKVDSKLGCGAGTGHQAGSWPSKVAMLCAGMWVWWLAGHVWQAGLGSEAQRGVGVGTASADAAVTGT